MARRRARSKSGSTVRAPRVTPAGGRTRSQATTSTTCTSRQIHFSWSVTFPIRRPYWWWSRYDTCNHTGGFRAALAADGQQQPEAEREAYRRGRGGGLPPQLRGAGPAEGGAHPLPLRNLAYPCGGEQAMQVYMGLPQVKAALHVPPDAVFYDSDGMGAQYTYGSRDQRPWYRKVVGEGRLRILVYSGDADTCVNTLWSEWWTSGLGISEVESWRGWTMDNETAMAGYVTRYAHDFDFLTIRGAGHM